MLDKSPGDNLGGTPQKGQRVDARVRPMGGRGGAGRVPLPGAERDKSRAFGVGRPVLSSGCWVFKAIDVDETFVT